MNYGTKQGHFLGSWNVILVILGRWSYGKFKDDNNIFHKMKNDLTTGTWQDNIWCSINIILLCTSDADHYGYWHSVVPVLVLANMYLESVPVWAHSITGTGIQLCPYQYWHFALWVSTSMGRFHSWYWLQYPAVCMRRPRRAVTHTTQCPARWCSPKA